MVYQLKSYYWQKDVKYSVPAEVVGKVLEDIEKRDGGITKKSFLEESRPENAPTHGMFEWNNTKAAEKYRVLQAGKIISSLKVSLKIESREEPIETTAVLNVSDKQVERGKYINVVSAMSSEDSRKKVLLHAMTELQQFTKKYAELTELADVFKAIANVKIA